MTESQKLKLQLVDLNRQIADAKEEDREALQKRFFDLNEAQIRAEAAETAQVDGDFSGANGQPSAEHREAMAITHRADLGAMVGNIIGKTNTGGAEAEAQSAWQIQGNEIPMAMIAELRTVSAPDDGGGPSAFTGYVFPASFAQFANVARPHVPAGVHVFPSFATAGAAGRPAEGAAHGSSEPTLRGELLSPLRIQAQASVSVEDMGRFSGIGPALAAHLSQSVAAALDAQALTDPRGFLDSVAASQPLTPITDPTSTDYAAWSAVLNSAVDGRVCPNLALAGFVMNADAFGDAAENFRGNNSSESIAERISRVARLQVSSAMPATVSDVASILVIRGRQQAAVQPIWPAIRLTDPYTDSGTGLVKFTAIALAAFSVQTPDSYLWQKVFTG